MGIGEQVDRAVPRARTAAVQRSLVVATTFGLSTFLAARLDLGTEFALRSFLWITAGLVAVLIGARRRPEPPAAWVVLGTGMLVVGGSWGARSALVDTRVLGTWPDLLSAVGLLVMGLGLLLAGKTRRERVALFDGALLAGAVTTFAWSILLTPQMADVLDGGPRLAAGSHLVGAALVLGVGGALALADRVQRTQVGGYHLLFLLTVLMAGIGWGWQGLVGSEQALAGSASWLLAPMMVAAMALTPEAPVRPDAPDADAVPSGPGQLLTPVRFSLLVFLTVIPAVTVGMLRAAPSMRFRDVPVTMGLWVTAAAVIILALRIRAVGGFAIEDERAIVQQRFAHLIEHSADVVCVIDADGILEYVSPSARRVFGYDPDETVGVHVSTLIEEATPERIGHLRKLAVEGRGRPVPLRLEVLAGDGLTRPAEGTITDLTELPSVNGLVVTLRDVSARVALEEELKRAALEDPLTGLANRTLLTDRIRHALAQQVRGGSGAALVYLDLDDFKAVNDTHGHAAGDRLLIAVANRMRDVVRDVDTPGRLGGDEFAILLEGLATDDVADDARIVVRRLLEQFRDPVSLGNELIEIRSSIGLAVAERGMTVEALMQNADMAMYAAKAAGGSRFVLHTEELSMGSAVTLDPPV